MRKLKLSKEELVKICTIVERYIEVVAISFDDTTEFFSVLELLYGIKYTMIDDTEVYIPKCLRTSFREALGWISDGFAEDDDMATEEIVEFAQEMKRKIRLSS